MPLPTLLNRTASDLATRSQSHDRITVWDMHDRRVRTSVHVDTSYPSQSNIVGQVWDGSKWNVATSILGTDPDLAIRSARDLPALFDKIEARLLDEISNIIL